MDERSREEADLMLYIRAFGMDEHAKREEARLKINIKNVESTKRIFLRPAELSAMEIAKAEDERKRMARTHAEMRDPTRWRLVEEPSEPDRYLFSESAYNMTGWANLNYGTRSY